ncbi:arylsulfatase [Algoriphagus pacificus]|uniref:Arylsulfatase n=1 Tax=Algoriphagus pacificus TaxID=2811234 RepID=A0ABS3CJQ2_9BACT|nr:arylsulfatase [Algoriphagus pacificus]MBN7816990.1 arylsulfatase [Algoriphagus pacificus]
MNRFLILLGFFYPFTSFAQDILPFPIVPSSSIAGETMEESTHQHRQQPSYLPGDAPNIIVILIDDSGPALPDTYGGEVHTPTLTKLANQGISYNRFHSTAMCSPTRASLLTGRNHTRVGNGQITEWANDWDGFSGVIPKTSATVAEVLKNYGYSTSAFGKWHNTNPGSTSKAGPFDEWPTGYGFEYFYGFLGGETSQYEPTLVRNNAYVDHPPKTVEEGYHLTDDLADDAIKWIENHQALKPNQPFFMYWAPGAVHGPHHVNNKWADKYKGKFDDGWDAYRKRVFERQKELGWIPENTILTERPETMAAWDEIPEDEKDFQRRLMEVFAGFTEHADYNVGRIVDAVEELGIDDNTLIFYIWGDNGSSSEGQNGTISELLAQNQIPTEISDHIRVMNQELGGLDALGGPKTDNMYHAGWAWAGATPFRSTKLVAAHFGGTRQPMVVSWPDKIKADGIVRSQFHHVNDITPTIYEVLNIPLPKVVNGFEQDVMDGISMAYTFDQANAEGKKKTQFFDVMGSRAIYHEGWMASTFGPRVPWMTRTPGLESWNPKNDVWELHNLENDFSQAIDLANEYPEKLEELKQLFLEESRRNKNLPIGGGLYVLLHPEELKVNPRSTFIYPNNTVRVPESNAPRLGLVRNKTTIELTNPSNSSGVIFALAGYAGGLTLYVEEGILNYEYNLFEIERTKLKSSTKLPDGDVNIELVFEPKAHASKAFLQAANITITVNGEEMIKGSIPTIITAGFSVNECFDLGADLGSPVSEAYYSKAPFKYTGQIHSFKSQYLVDQ